eukprot:SAG22_NODE_4866_length_1147_cov_17.396947_1_plen_88_part_00
MVWHRSACAATIRRVRRRSGAAAEIGRPGHRLAGAGISAASMAEGGRREGSATAPDTGATVRTGRLAGALPLLPVGTPLALRLSLLC